MSSEDPPRPPRPSRVTLEVLIGGWGKRVDRGGEGSPVGMTIVGEEDVGACEEDVEDMVPSAAALATAAASPTWLIPSLIIAIASLSSWLIWFERFDIGAGREAGATLQLVAMNQCLLLFVWNEWIALKSNSIDCWNDVWNENDDCPKKISRSDQPQRLRHIKKGASEKRKRHLKYVILLPGDRIGGWEWCDRKRCWNRWHNMDKLPWITLNNRLR